MSKTTRKKEPIAPITREQMEAALVEYRAGRIDEQKAAEWHNRAKARLDAKLAEKQTAIKARIDAAFALLKAWAKENKSAFETVRSIAKPIGTIGYRTATPSLKLLDGWTWEQVLEVIQALPEIAVKYVRTKYEVNKEAIIADRDALGETGLRALGVRVSQPTSFFADANLITTQPVQKEKA